MGIKRFLLGNQQNKYTIIRQKYIVIRFAKVLLQGFFFL